MTTSELSVPDKKLLGHVQKMCDESHPYALRDEALFTQALQEVTA